MFNNSVVVFLLLCSVRPALFFPGTGVWKRYKECQSDPNTHVDEELLRKGLRGELADETPVGPHALCMNIKRGFQNSNGDVDVVALREYLDQAEDRNETLIEQVIKECGQNNGTNAQQAALALLDCIHRIIPHKEEHHQTVRGKKDELHRIHDECQSDPSTLVDDQTFLKFLRGEKVDEPALGRHVLCMNVKGGLQSPNGDTVQDGLKAFLNGKTKDTIAVERIVKECGPRKGGSSEEAAVALVKCFTSNAQGVIDFIRVFKKTHDRR